MNNLLNRQYLGSLDEASAAANALLPKKTALEEMKRAMSPGEPAEPTNADRVLQAALEIQAAGGTPFDARPIAQLADAWSGSRLANSMETPETPIEQAAKVIQKLPQKKERNALDDLAALARIDASQATADRARRATATKASPFDAAKLKKLGTAAADWATGDRETFVSNVGKVDNAIGLLGSKTDLSGGGKGKVPDFIREFTNPDALIARDSIQSAIADTLRPTLGAQFTEKEGQRIMNLAFNAGLPQAENLRRAQELKKMIERKVQATDALYAYIEANGTDAGFPFEKFGMRKVGASAPVPGRSASPAPREDRSIDDELREELGL